MRFPTLKLVLGLGILSACKTEPTAPSAEHLAEIAKAPNVNEMVKPDQDKWLAGQVQNPGKGGIKRLVVFGDSMSDPGSLNRRTLGMMAPARIYYQSRFSNGPIWADYVKPALGWTVDNFAVAGAESGKVNKVEGADVPSVLAQVAEQKDQLKLMDFNTTLMAIWIGPNNYLRHGIFVQDANLNPEQERLDKLVADGVKDIREAIEDLHGLGFKHFIVGTMIELGALNRDPKGPPLPSDATLYAATAAHNTALRTMVKDLGKADPTVSINVFQAAEINQATIDKPKNFGFNRLDAPCYTGSMQGKFDGEKRYCSDPSGYKYWDFLHPNSKMHCYYAGQFLADITAAGRVAGFDQNKANARCLQL